MAEKTDLHVSDESTSEDDDSTVDVDVSTPSPRFWHFSQLVKGNVYIGGGNIPKFDDEKERARLVKTIEQFNVEERTWRQRETKGDHHPGLTAVACASFGKYLFAYGGNTAKDLSGVLSQLDLDTFTWSRLSPETADGPMKKDASGMVYFGEDSLAVVCGYAHPRDPSKDHGGSSDQESTFIAREGPSADGDGWTNEMHVFNINRKTKDDHQGMWTTFSFTGSESRPPPCADFSLTSVDLYRAVLYGGDRGTDVDKDSSDLYIIDFSEKAIMKIQPQNKEGRWPKMRLGHHAACCLDFNTENPQLLISGGRIKQDIPPKDIWILNITTRKWKQVELLIADDSIQKQLARWGHTFTAITHSAGLVEVIMFGGSPGYYEVTWDLYKRKDFRRLAFPVSLIFGLLDMEWAILDVLDCSQQWTSETMTPFDLESAIKLDVLYSMERDRIPVLTELMRNKKIRSTVCSEDMEADLKWPTFTKPSIHKPTWENLTSILKLVKENDLIKRIKRYLKNMKGQISRDSPLWKQEEEEETKKSQLLAGHSASTIQMLEARNEKLQEEVERLRCQLELQHVSTEQNVNGNASSPMITDAALLQSNVGDFPLCGIDVCGETICEITNSAQSFEWEECGLRLLISEGSLPEGVDKCTVSIMASVSGQYQFPEDIHLVSTILLLRCEPPCKFEKTITMELDHCAPSANASKLSFVRAFCTQKTLPYIFKKIGGHFSGDSRTGSVKLNGFSFVGIGGPPQREYGTTIFHFTHQRSLSNCCLKIDVVMTWNTKKHLNTVKKEYRRKDAELDSEMVVKFESDEINIEISLDDTSVEGGWKISPNTPPIVLKSIVDNYDQGQIIPKCQFSAKILPGGGGVPSLQCQVKLNGAKSPYNEVTLDITPPQLASEYQPVHASKKRSSSESDVPETKRRRKEHVQKSHSLDSKMSSIAEDVDSNVASSPISSANPDKIATQSAGMSKPEMRNLTIFQWKNENEEVKKFCLKSLIVHQWRKIGDIVVASYPTLEVWSKERNAEECCDAVLNHWLAHPPPDYPATWEGLYELLEDCQLLGVANELKLAVNKAIQ